MSSKLLIVDDDDEFIHELGHALLSKLPGFTFSFASSPESCLANLESESFEVVLLDIQFGANRSEGFDLIRSIKDQDPQAEVLMLSSLDDCRSIALAMKQGASDFISKITSFDEIALRVQQALGRRRKRLMSVDDQKKRRGVIYSSKKMEDVFAIADKAKRATSLNVLISGPTGSGKEVVAQTISRADEGIPFIALNCGAISKTLVISEFFGHERGAFTGATTRQIGRFEAANGGDIFLDEVDSLDMEAQTALLRALETKEIVRVGSTLAKKLDFRVIAATNADIEDKIRRGLFREDLYARLQGIGIQIPPLTSRREDIPALVEYFMNNVSKEKIHIAPECLEILKAYHWPQNIRQLKQVIESMMALADGNFLSLGDIPIAIKKSISSDGKPDRRVNQMSLTLELGRPIDEVVNTVTRKYVAATIKALGTDANQTELAKALHIPRTTLQRKLMDLGLTQSAATSRFALKGDQIGGC